MVEGRIVKISGPLVIAEGMKEANMFDVVHVGENKLIGEIIEMHGDRASIQVYEETAGLGRGERVVSTGMPLSVELGPGIVTNIYDGIQRPLEKMMEICGSNIQKGIDLPALDRDKKWSFTASVKAGTQVSGGDIVGFVDETEVIRHKIMIPPNMNGTVKELFSGEYTVTDRIGVLETENGEVPLTLMQKWPVRRSRPYREKLPPSEPMVTGQRTIDTLFPIAKGGTACTVLNSANEAAVGLFLEDKIPFYRIGELVADACENVREHKEVTLGNILDSENTAREYVITHV